MEPEAGAKQVTTSATRFWLSSEGIVYNQNLVEGTVEEAHLVEGLAALRELTNGQRAVLLADGGSRTAATREARAYMAGPQGRESIGAMVVVAHSPVARVVMSFFARFTKPPYPTHVCATVEDARVWARGQVARLHADVASAPRP